ncbi:hypothetical protein GCM10017056_33230 [Seohaeicola zhoushanensis]|uniref:Uncharacterized protein n=1 Tax=Seohaeicola zhoushanensis TaxID=1569283 RepID=A0A8J3M9G2_9RHOB|nr:hypothetical protein GCM10017056_33230 [Seohaeicola zhoushanensis]
MPVGRPWLNFASGEVVGAQGWVALPRGGPPIPNARKTRPIGGEAKLSGAKLAPKAGETLPERAALRLG